MKKISIIMPALNEEEGVRESINSVSIPAEIIIVDGGSFDGTVAVARELGARVIISKRGYGRQYKAGFKEAGGEIIITGDSDGTYPFEKIADYLKVFEQQNLEFMTINRFADMEEGAMPLVNKIGNKFLTFVMNLLFNFKIKDSQSGMWIFKKSCLPVLNLRSDSMAMSEEIKIEAFRKLKSLEISGSYKKRIGKTKLLKIKHGFANLFWLFRKKFFN